MFPIISFLYMVWSSVALYHLYMDYAGGRSLDFKKATIDPVTNLAKKAWDLIKEVAAW